MGFFKSYSTIGKINNLLKEIETKMNYVGAAIDTPYINRSQVLQEITHIKLLMNDIVEAMEDCGSNSVVLASYRYHGQWMGLLQIVDIVKHQVMYAESKIN